jgi:fucose 4-O-acetylase-like acetyltransferase
MARRADIDMARGLAILLVVFGHIVARADPAGVNWYEPLRRAVYAFHMPFFLYLSGLTAALSGTVLTPRAGWAGFAKRRARRLLVPFFGLGALILVGKIAASHWMFVDHSPSGLVSGVGALIWHTADSPALSIWYLFVLFVLSVTAPLLLGGDPGRAWLLAVLGLLLYALVPPPICYLDRVGRYAIFFVLGVCAGLRDASWTAFVERAWPPCLVLLCGLLVADALWGAQWPETFVLLPAGIVSMPALHGLVRHLPQNWHPVFLWLGQYGFMIYLFNTVFIGLAKGAALHFVGWDAQWFGLLAPALMAAGVFGPVALKRFGFGWNQTLDRLTD